MAKEKVLSASRIKTLKECSYKYWCNYHKNLPESTNDGQIRGTVCHTVLEMLLHERHKRYVKIISDSRTIESVPSVARLVKKNLTKLGHWSEQNYTMCDEMLLVALDLDFFGKRGASIPNPEKEFLLESENPKFKIRGYIDKPIEYKSKIKMVDYKTSKDRFSPKEVDFPIQGLTYLLAARALWPKIKKTSIEFQFLRWPEEPTIEIKATQEELDGFEIYLAGVFNIINNFTELDSTTNLPAYEKYPPPEDGFVGPLLCGYGKYPGHIKPATGLPYWVCEYKWPYDYYALLDEKGKVLKVSKDEEELQGIEGIVEKRHHEGCPAHKPNLKLKEEHIAQGKKVGDVDGGSDSNAGKIIDDFDF